MVKNKLRKVASEMTLNEELKNNKLKKKQNREAPMKWVQEFISKYDIQNCLFVTLTSNKEHSPSYINKALDDWLNNIYFRIYRCNKNDLQNGKNIRALAFMERNEKGHIHYHLIIYVDSIYKDYFKRLCDKFWKKRICHGTTDIQEITNPNGLSSYVTKELYKQENSDYLYLF